MVVMTEPEFNRLMVDFDILEKSHRLHADRTKQVEQRNSELTERIKLLESQLRLTENELKDKTQRLEGLEK